MCERVTVLYCLSVSYSVTRFSKMANLPKIETSIKMLHWTFMCQNFLFFLKNRVIYRLYEHK